MWPFLQTPNSACGCSSQSGTNQCGCDKISSLDVSYNGPALVCSGIERCDSLTVALQKIEEKICTAGTVSGVGINNYVARWTPNGTTLGIGLIRDNNTSLGINTAAVTDRLISAVSSTHRVGNYINIVSTFSAGETAIATISTANSTNTGGENIGLLAGATGSTIVNKGIESTAVQITSAENIGGRFEANNSSSANYAIQLQDGTEGIGKVLTCITANGKANWVTPTTGVAGSGINNYIARWTPSGTQLGTGLIQDNNDTISIGTILDSNIFININASNPQGALLRNTNTTNVITSGISAETNGVNTQENRGIEAYSLNSTSVNTAFRGGATSNAGGKAVGGHFIANGPGVNYSVRLSDGTQALDKVLTCVTINGEANWNKVTSNYTTGASGSFTSNDGKTITVTNGLITSIV